MSLVLHRIVTPQVTSSHMSRAICFVWCYYIDLVSLDVSTWYGMVWYGTGIVLLNGRHLAHHLPYHLPYTCHTLKAYHLPYTQDTPLAIHSRHTTCHTTCHTLKAHHLAYHVSYHLPYTWHTTCHTTIHSPLAIPHTMFGATIVPYRYQLPLMVWYNRVWYGTVYRLRFRLPSGAPFVCFRRTFTI